MSLLFIAALPSRLAEAMTAGDVPGVRIQRLFAGALVDTSAAAPFTVLVIAALTLGLPVLFKRFRNSSWQARGAVWLSLPFGFLLWGLTVTAQEVKGERGAYPTMFDFLEGGTNASFLSSALSYLRYQRLWLPAALGVAALTCALWLVMRREAGGEARDWSRWPVGVLSGLCGGVLALSLLTSAMPLLGPTWTAAYVGDPMTGVLESAWDLLRSRGRSTPRELVLTAELPPGAADTGLRRLGLPASRRRPLDFTQEPAAPGRALLDAFARVSRALFTEGSADTIVWQLSLEGFRADDVHALNAAAPREVAPFTTQLYERPHGVLASRRMFQAGVRTAHCLGAMTCGLGTLPYNLAFIRDLQPFEVRCLSDVLGDAQFSHSFFYGSDAHFDDMHRFFEEHRYTRIVSQAELPPTLPKGTWKGVTDFAVFDEAVRQAQAQRGPQFMFLMSLSNHSPFTPPEDLPAAVKARAEGALREAKRSAGADDALRLVTFSYTDAAIERFFTSLNEAGLADRSIVVLLADHSTGHNLVWAKEGESSDEAKARIPFIIAVPDAFRARVADVAELDAAMAEAQWLLGELTLSQNDVPALLLALLSAHPHLRELSGDTAWHTLGGQVTSPYFEAGVNGAAVIGINGISELYMLDKSGSRVGDYEPSVFLNTRADRYTVTPSLISVTAALQQWLASQPR